MHFFSDDASSMWCAGCGYQPDTSGRPTVLPERHDGQAIVSWSSGFDLEFTQTAAFARAIVEAVPTFDHCVMWVTQTGIWRSSENLHLYYQLRQSYGERTTLHEAPGHLFHDYERPAMATFVQVAILFGWDFHLLASPGYITLFGSHDEYLVISADDPTSLENAVRCVSGFCKAKPTAISPEAQI